MFLFNALSNALTISFTDILDGRFMNLNYDRQRYERAFRNAWDLLNF